MTPLPFLPLLRVLCGLRVNSDSLPSRVILSPKMEADIQFMQEALAEARSAAAAGEVPIGAVLVHSGKILARSGNRTIRDCDPTAPKGGAVRSCFEILSHPRLNHQVEVTYGVLAADCSATLQSFFAERR